MKNWFCLIFLLGLIPVAAAQVDTLRPNSAALPMLHPIQGRIADPVVYPSKRKRIVAVGSVAAAAGSLLVLNEAWYKQYPKKGFHTFNDSREWLQVDKLGHAWTAYQVSRGTMAFWQWAGVRPNNAVLLGSISGMGYLTIIEWLDGHSQKWGWSWADVGANTAGTLLFATQQIAWKEQRLQIKFSALPHRYDPSLQPRADGLFGKTFTERLLKDYNAQTYWLSANIRSFWKNSQLPAWLNIAIGYGASGMWGGFENKALDKDGNTVFDRRDIARRRQWYLAPDVDFTKIKTGRKGIRTLLQGLNCLKFPAPALEWSNGKLSAKLLAY